MGEHNTDDNALVADYWATYWRNHERVRSEDMHFQVGRTVGGVAIDADQWAFQLSEIDRVLNLQPTDTLLDLCAGNGMISVPLSLKCRETTAVDISDGLLKQIDTQNFPAIDVVVADVRSVALRSQHYSKGLLYFALQYFNERETIGVFRTIYDALMPQGRFLVGDIPDIDRLFQFHRKPEWVSAYFESVETGKPVVGHWFKQDILLALARHVGFSHAAVLQQHPSMPNTHYRFDLLLTK